jgi:lipoprotein-anchoring transpeptidase ErfK/SrfK
MSNPQKKLKIYRLAGMFLITGGVLGFFYSVWASPEAFQIKASFEKYREVGLQEPVKIKFESLMMKSQTENSVSLSPKSDAIFSWEDDGKTLVITPKHFWQAEKEYRVSVKNARNIVFREVNEEFYFNTEGYPKVIEFYPEDGEKDVLLDIEDPITATFDKSVDDFKIKFVIHPFHNLVYQVEKEGKKIKLLSQNSFERGKSYEIEVWARYKEESDKDYRKIYTTSFETKPYPPSTWEKDLNLRLEQARRFTDPKILSGKYIDINVKSQVMTIFENSRLLDAYLVSSGKRGMPTPQGNFKISNKFPRAWSKKYGLFMPFWMAIVPSGDFGIHELPEWPGGYKEGANHLGTPVSHGCVRLGVGPAEHVYNWANIGTPVVVHE